MEGTPRKRRKSGASGTANAVSQVDARLIILLLAPVGSIFFALISLIVGEAGRFLFLTASSLTGSIGLITGIIMLIVQLARQDLNLRNTLIFSGIFLLSIFVFASSCTVAIVRQSALD